MIRTELTELPDRWILPLRGDKLVKIDLNENVMLTLDSQIRIILGYGAFLTLGSFWAQKENRFRINELNQDQLDQILGSTVVSAVGFKNGAFRIVFDTGWQFNVRASDESVPAAVIAGDTAMWVRTRPTDAVSERPDPSDDR
ncbi:MAG TPA: DUF6188 family protein [Pseudonocardiaceae bacterium]